MNAAQIARHYEVKESAVLSWRLVDGGATIRALIDYGIGGVKVYEAPLWELAGPSIPPRDEPYDLSDMDYRQLQALAKAKEIPANQSKDDLLTALAEDEEE